MSDPVSDAVFVEFIIWILMFVVTMVAVSLR